MLNINGLKAQIWNLRIKHMHVTNECNLPIYVTSSLKTFWPKVFIRFPV